MSALSYASIVGYSSHLLLKHVTLPLKYLADDVVLDSAELFRNKAFSFGGFIDLSSQKGLFFSCIQYGVENNRKTIHLTPILTDEVTSLSVQFQSIQIHLPHPIIGKSMAVFQFVTLSTEKEPYIVVDLIDESYLLISLKIELSDFLAGNLNNRLVLDSFNEWVDISVPYSFELRSSPFIMQAIDSCNLIVALKDGGLLHFSRPSVLASVDIFNFSEAASLISFNLGSIFGPNKNDYEVDGISSNAIVDVVRISEFQFATLSVRKCLKVWNFKSHKQERPTIDFEKNLLDSSWLTLIPSKYMQTHEVGSSRYLSVIYATDTDPDATSGYYLKSFVILPDGLLQEKAAFGFSPELPLSSLSSESTAFKIQDFQVLGSQEPSHVTYYILWKSSTYSVVVCYDVNTTTGMVTEVRPSISHTNPLSDELTLSHGESYYRNLIFNSGLYDNRIVDTALQIFKSKFGHSIAGLTGTKLRQNVAHCILNASKASGVSLSTLWYKLFLICEEFRKLSKEPLALLVTSTAVLVCEVNGVGVFRDAHMFEKFAQNSGNTELSSLLSALSSKFSSNTKRKLADEIKELSQVTAQEASRLASDYLSSRISEEEVADVMGKMSRMPNVVDEIRDLIGKDFCDEVILDEYSSVRSGEGFGLFSKLLTVNTFKSIKGSHESILLNLFILFLLCEVDDSVLNFLSSIWQRFSRYVVFDNIFDVSFTGSSAKSGIEDANVSLLENSIFWTAAVGKYPELLALIKARDYNLSFDYYSEPVLGTHYNELILNVVLDLLNRNEASVVEEKFSQTFEIKSPLNKFLFGLLSLTNNKPAQFAAGLSDYQTFRAIDTPEIKHTLLKGLNSNAELKSFLSSVFAKLQDDVLSHANYLHEVARLSKAYSQKTTGIFPGDDSLSKEGFLKESLTFEKRAVEILETAPEQNHDVVSLKVVLLRNLFEESLDLLDLNGAITSLEQLSPLISRGDLKAYFTRLIKTLITRREISRAFSTGKNTLFIEHYLLVDSILLEIANNDLILSNALRCYEFLYSWRLFGCSTGCTSSNLGDKRGAAEALYIFITRFRLEQENLGLSSNESEDFKQFKLKVLELYMIIINCLKTFEDPEDQWFVKRDTAQRLSVVKLNEVTLEYYKWVKDLEKDLEGSLA